MAPPCAYSDISKDATDLISKDYPVGSTKLEINTTSDNGIVNHVNRNLPLMVSRIMLRARLLVISKQSIRTKSVD